MTFDEFVSRRSAELLRFAFVICGDRDAAESLAEQAALRTFADLGQQVDDPEAWANAARVWTVRGFLSEGMRLGAPLDPDVDAEVEPAGAANGLTDNFARSSKLQRTVLVLHYREHFSEGEIANLVGSSADGIVAYIGAILERLDVSAPGQLRSYSEQDLRRVLHVLGTDLASSADLSARIVAALPKPEPTEAEIAAAEQVAAEAAAAEAALAAELAATEAALAAELAAAELAAAELAAAEAAQAAADLEALVTGIAAATATDVATTTATATATDVAGAVAATTATEISTTAADVSITRAGDVAREVAAETAATLATDLATSTSTEVAAGIAKDTAATIASDVATATAQDVAAATAGEIARTTATEIATSVADNIATRIATEVATQVAAQAIAHAVAGAVAEALDDALDAAIAAGSTQSAAEPVMISEPVADDELADTDSDLVPAADPDNDAQDPVLLEPAAAVEAEEPADAGEADPKDEAIDAVDQGEPADDTAEVLEPKESTFDVQVKQPPAYPSQKIVRPLIVLTAVLGLNYLIWRWTFSVNWAVWWISVPLVIAETYSLIDSLLFGFTMWRLRRRPDPGPPPEGATVDVFITTYNEPIELIMKTAHAAQRITYPHTLWILDDANRPELKELAESEGIGVISRSSDWIDMPRHARAGNLNNALMVTQGEFIVILDADQVPAPELLDHTLGYFNDEKMAIVQTPQFFVNVPKSDPLGRQAPLFYGPIQQGQDGWNSAFFCGSNAVLRREALLQMGVRHHVLELELRIQDALGTAEKVIRKARAGRPAGQDKVDEALVTVLAAAQEVRDELDQGRPIADATTRLQNVIEKASREVVETDLAASQADLAELFDLIGDEYVESPATALNAEALDRLARRDWSPLGAIETVRALIAAVDVDREDEDQPIMPMSTISVSEDMATCMRIHSMGWKSAYHDEILAVGLAPEDLGTMLTQRLRWAQGTVQVMLRENPLRQKGLSFAQRLMYLGTMWSCLSGFAALAYIAAPVIFLVSGVLPVDALSAQFFARLIPFLVINQVLFFVIGRGRATWRGQQYSLALFPVWIKAVTSAVGNVVFGRSLSFAVTPKTRVKLDRRPWRLVRPQLLAMGLLFAAGIVGIVRYSVGDAAGLGTIINLVWVVFDLALFSAIPRALFYKGFEPESEEPPAPAEPATSPTVTLQEISR